MLGVDESIDSKEYEKTDLKNIAFIHKVENNTIISIEASHSLKVL